LTATLLLKLPSKILIQALKPLTGILPTSPLVVNSKAENAANQT
jgi:hypothetical protein